MPVACAVVHVSRLQFSQPNRSTVSPRRRNVQENLLIRTFPSDLGAEPKVTRLRERNHKRWLPESDRGATGIRGTEHLTGW